MNDLSINLSSVCNLIIIFGSAYFTILKIVDSFAKPTSKIKQKKEIKKKEDFEKVLNDLMPRYLYEHSQKVAQERDLERKENNRIVTDEILNKIDGKIEELKLINIHQDEQISILESMISKINNSSKDIMRQKIMAIYHANKRSKILTIYDKESLDELYKDYTSQEGNSYITKYYKRMQTWKVIDEQEVD